MSGQRDGGQAKPQQRSWLESRQRTTVLDTATLVLPRTARFYAAASVLTLRPDKEIAAAVRRTTPAISDLLAVVVAKPPGYQRARRKAETAVSEFRATVDKARR